MSQLIEHMRENGLKYEFIVCAIALPFAAWTLWSLMGIYAVILCVALAIVSVIVDRVVYYSIKVKYEDERNSLVISYASRTTLFTAVVMIIGLGVLISDKIIPEISSTDLLGLVILIIFIPLIGWYAYYNHKGPAIKN